jgi:hypothetical protein
VPINHACHRHIDCRARRQFLCAAGQRHTPRWNAKGSPKNTAGHRPAESLPENGTSRCGSRRPVCFCSRACKPWASDRAPFSGPEPAPSHRRCRRGDNELHRRREYREHSDTLLPHSSTLNATRGRTWTCTRAARRSQSNVTSSAAEWLAFLASRRTHAIEPRRRIRPFRITEVGPARC